MERQHTSELWGPNRPQKIGENLSRGWSLDASESDLSDGHLIFPRGDQFPVANFTFRAMLKSGLSPQGLGADWGRIGVGGGGRNGGRTSRKIDFRGRPRPSGIRGKCVSGGLGMENQ